MLIAAPSTTHKTIPDSWRRSPFTAPTEGPLKLLFVLCSRLLGMGLAEMLGQVPSQLVQATGGLDFKCLLLYGVTDTIILTGTLIEHGLRLRLCAPPEAGG